MAHKSRFFSMSHFIPCIYLYRGRSALVCGTHFSCHAALAITMSLCLSVRLFVRSFVRSSIRFSYLHVRGGPWCVNRFPQWLHTMVWICLGTWAYFLVDTWFNTYVSLSQLCRLLKMDPISQLSWLSRLVQFPAS